MRFKLIQRGAVFDSADCIEKLDFSVLSRRSDWKVVVDFGDGDETIATVMRLSLWSIGPAGLVMSSTLVVRMTGVLSNVTVISFRPCKTD